MHNKRYTHSMPSERGERPRAKRSLGQNFLQDANIARKIVNCLAIEPEDFVLEIGPGPGALTRFISGCHPARLVLVEKDGHWAAERMAVGNGQIQVILSDALTMPWERFGSPWKFIGNLPYNVASPLMWDIFSRSRGLSRAVFMVQKEVALRVIAGPGSSAYGALSIWLQTFVKPRLEFIVPPQVFRPRPKVDSAVLSFSPLEGGAGWGPENNRERDRLSRTLKACFQMRRKQLGTIAKSIGCACEILDKADIASTRRPEELTPEQFRLLAELGFFAGKH